ncbi:MAG TPA: NAD(P)H-hydrate dehydratase [Methyloceanibacter sp.]|jgi:ADP-dependent NAD(P)H-hydrate dehydratase / NAD(P)H-hydrate epimerase|nr:NAD(P)H-hydrate dehydratase [Methyloceanibacter sp.]
MLELLTAEEMGRADRLTIQDGIKGAVLMENAGRAVADEVSRRFPDAETVMVLCGPGNNGGDGFVAARHLRERGYKVRLGFNGDPTRLPTDAAAMAKLWSEGRVKLSADLLAGSDVVVDALFGAGLARPIEGAFAELIDDVNASGLPVVAIDVPSGIDGTTGEVRGTAIEAVSTVTFFRLKPGHLLLPGRLHCGEVKLAQIGIPDSLLTTIAPKAFANEPLLWLSNFPWPKPEGHKYARGHAVVVSGPAYSTGAARLGARGALRVGAGLVTVASPRDAIKVNAAQLTAIMVREANDARALANLLADERKNAVLIGPGILVGERTKELVFAALASNAAVVLDADAITSFSDDAKRLFAAIRSRKAPVIMTPHDGEFARLFGDIRAASKLERAREAAARSGAVILLKGSDTVVAAPDAIASVNATTSQWLATAGSGDVLGGMVAGLLAQRMTAFQAASAAVWLHGSAAKAFGPGLIAEDIPEMLPGVLRDLANLAPAKKT